jgi:phenylalanyl-tRNA synthetase beta chain
MRFTFSWLKKFLDTKCSLDEILVGLNSLGLEVESVTDRSNDLKGFKIAHIIEALPHPSSDRLQLCRVNDGESELQIVCGASNARTNLKVVLAPLGAVIPANGMQIVEAKIRSVESRGMLCSGDELLLKDLGEGIIELDDDAPVGASFMEYYQLNDPVIEISVTPNRADCLGVYGIARDLHAKGLGVLREISVPEIAGKFVSTMPLSIDKNICSLFIGCQVKNIENKPSPLWLRNLLKNSGLKPISAIVDVTNYICHSFAQPMHAFDADKIDSINIRKAKTGEQFLALNDKRYELQNNDIVIADNQDVHCLGGIIGGKDSAWSSATANLFLEAAFFDKDLITLSGRKHDIITDSRFRFERHVDDHFRLSAFKIACQMISEICGGDFSEILFQGELSRLAKIEFDYSLFKNKIGFELEIPLINEILGRLGYSVEVKSDNIALIGVPSWRDSTISEDILEEIVRVYDYDNIPEIQLPDFVSVKTLTDSFKKAATMRSALASIGYYEAVTWSFMSSKKAANFAELKQELTLLNPISSELNYLRGSIIPNLLDAVLKNYNRSIKDLKLFEIGPVFFGTKPEDEVQSVAALCTGAYEALNPHVLKTDLNVFDIKSDLEVLLREFNIAFDDIELILASKKYYHPNVSAELIYMGKNIGSFGAIHPKFLKDYGIEQSVFAFELYYDALEINTSKGEYKHFEYQPFQRDFAFVVDQNIPAGQIVSNIKKVDPDISSVRIFDVYHGKNVQDGKKSIAVNVFFRPSKTLSSEEIEFLCKRIIDLVKDEFSASLRS